MYTQTPTQQTAVKATQLIGHSPKALQIQEFATRAARSDHTILLRGESGVGKDHLADYIHEVSRPGKPFVAVDCGTLSESLSETELFGHTRGAFTDAKEGKEGLVNRAQHGTLFFNEIANMSTTMQAKFLRIMEKRTFRAVGSITDVQLKARIIVATNANLETMVSKGGLREDLYYRLAGITFVVPSLRDRKADIPELAEHFLRGEHQTRGFSPEALESMMEYDWPGNVRELKNVVVRALFSSSADGDIDAEHVVPYLRPQTQRELPTYLENQRNYLRDVLRRTRGVQVEACEIAQISTRVMSYKIRKLRLEEYVEALKKGTIPN